MAMGRLRREEIGNASGIYNLMRNIGGSVGIATVTTLLVAARRRSTRTIWPRTSPPTRRPGADAVAGLAAHLAGSGFDPWDAHRAALGALYRMVEQQASLMAYTR